MRIDDALGRYLQFSLDSPWNHAAVVVSVGQHHLDGVANEETERLLQRYPFRRASHRFCSPGYCRCFDSEEQAGKRGVWDHTRPPSTFEIYFPVMHPRDEGFRRRSV